MVREEQPVVESVPRIDVVPKGDVGQLEGEDSGQVLLVRQYIDQPSAEQDRVAHGERLERCGQQMGPCAASGKLRLFPMMKLFVNWFQHFIKVPNRGEPPGLHQPVQTFASACATQARLASQGTYILRRITLVSYISYNADGRVLCFRDSAA